MSCSAQHLICASFHALTSPSMLLSSGSMIHTLFCIRNSNLFRIWLMRWPVSTIWLDPNNWDDDLGWTTKRKKEMDPLLRRCHRSSFRCGNLRIRPSFVRGWKHQQTHRGDQSLRRHLQQPMVFFDFINSVPEQNRFAVALHLMIANLSALRTSFEVVLCWL